MFGLVRSVYGRVCSASLAVGIATYCAVTSVFAAGEPQVLNVEPIVDVSGAMDSLKTHAATLLLAALGLALSIWCVLWLVRLFKGAAGSK